MAEEVRSLESSGPLGLARALREASVEHRAESARAAAGSAQELSQRLQKTLVKSNEDGGTSDRESRAPASIGRVRYMPLGYVSGGSSAGSHSADRSSGSTARV